MMYTEKINWIQDTPLGFSIRSLNCIAPHMHDDMIEITMCIAGEIKISYCFEEITLNTGDYILVDKDTHYLYDGNVAKCVSLYFDLAKLQHQYPKINHRFFVCEYSDDSSSPCKTYEHMELKSMLLALLCYLASGASGEKDFTQKINTAVNNIISILTQKFDIVYFYNSGEHISDSIINKYLWITDYVFEHYTEKITLDEIAHQLGNNKIYLSALMSRYAIGFKNVVGFIRLCHAEKMMMTTDITMIDISEACGFSDTKFFYKYFKFWYNCTPKEFKKKYFNEMNKDSREEFLKWHDVSEDLRGLTQEHLIAMFL